MAHQRVGRTANSLYVEYPLPVAIVVGNSKRVVAWNSIRLFRDYQAMIRDLLAGNDSAPPSRGRPHGKAAIGRVSVATDPLVGKSRCGRQSLSVCVIVPKRASVSWGAQETGLGNCHHTRKLTPRRQDGDNHGRCTIYH